MDKKGYDLEAKHLSVIHNWRRACDERGLCSDLHSQFNQSLKAYILDDLMPWHEKNSDLSLLEVNRYYSLTLVIIAFTYNFTDPLIGSEVLAERLL